MVDLALVFPYFNDDQSFFKFPPLGLGYIAAHVRQHGYSVDLVDCTFLTWEEAVAKVRRLRPRVLGVYSMLSMRAATLRFAQEFRDECELLVAGGPQPTVAPQKFLNDFDFVGIGESEHTVLEILDALNDRQDYSQVHGLAYRNNSTRTTLNRGGTVTLQLADPITFTRPRERITDLDSLPFPARDLYDHESYQRYYRHHYGATMTQMMCSRGCPFACDFCSRPIFGNYYRHRTATNIIDEIEEIRKYGYERVWFSDDIFPISKKLVVDVCDEIVRRGVDIEWGCLCRADLLNEELASKMRKAGCFQVFFGLESGNNDVLKIMNKGITIDQSRRAVSACAEAGIKVGAFFILGYPGETVRTMLDTIRFASSLPLDYFSFTVPYPIPGTKLYEKVMHRMVADEWVKPAGATVDQKLIWASDFSEKKLRFGIRKARIQATMRRRLGSAYPLLGKPVELATDLIFRSL